MSLTDILMGLWVSRLPLKERKQHFVKPPEPKIRCIELDTVYNSVVDALMQVFGKNLKQAKPLNMIFWREYITAGTMVALTVKTTFILVVRYRLGIVN